MVVAQGVVDAVKQEHTVALTMAENTDIPVITAQKRRNRMCIPQRLSRMKPLRIRMVSPSGKQVPLKSVELPAAEHYLPQPDSGKPIMRLLFSAMIISRFIFR